jgi:hypothetical protein
VRPLDEWGNDAESTDDEPASEPAPMHHVAAPTVSPLEAAWAEVDAALVRARAIGPRPLPPRIPCPPCATCGLRESEFGDICPPCEEAEYQAAQKVLT